jgi:hypothetical protein
MHITVEALIIALRGAADALEDWSQDGLGEEPEPKPEPKPAATDEPPAPWEAEETPPQVEEVTAQDIIALYQEVAAQGKKVDMLSLLSGLGVERVGELDNAGRAKLHAAIKEAAGM